jgi:hypothetical protein
VEASAFPAPDRKHNVSIPRTSPHSKSARLALAATGAAAAVAVLASGTAAAASGGPAPSYRVAAGAPASSAGAARPGADSAASRSLAAIQSGVAASRIQPVSGPRPSPPAKQATRPVASQHKQTAPHKPAGKLRLAFGDKLAGASGSTAKHQSGAHQSGQHVAPAHRGHSRAARARACADSTLHWWICHAEGVLERHGTPRGKLSTNAAYIVVQHESGGNPHAFNGWDINAAQGHPSEGIAQVIAPTFHAYALHGYRDIWNPVDNMIAAFRYAISRYGSMNNIPGVVAVRHGGSYVGY